VLHAYGSRDATFNARASLDAEAVSLEIRDHGKWRAPRGRRGGRGLSVMRELCDDVKIDRGADGTTVKMRRVFADHPTDIDRAA
jgi:anti-sigma regulatory factor (Ser/Thr protein kinase)